MPRWWSARNFSVPRHLTPHLLEEICGDVALVIEHETFMPGEIVVDKYDPQISPREYLYIVNNGSVLLRRGGSFQNLPRLVIRAAPLKLFL